MEINVSQLLKSPIGSEREYDINETIDVSGDRAGYHVRGGAKLTRTDRGILVRGALTTDAAFTCSRCLCLFRCPLSFNIEEEYYPTIDVITGAALPLPEEPERFTIDERHTLDLTEAIRQGVLLAIPMKPLCVVDCAGLCPDCGLNLNQGPCSCPPRGQDRRWAELAKLGMTDKEKGK